MSYQHLTMYREEDTHKELQGIRSKSTEMLPQSTIQLDEGESARAIFDYTCSEDTRERKAQGKRDPLQSRLESGKRTSRCRIGR